MEAAEECAERRAAHRRRVAPDRRRGDPSRCASRMRYISARPRAHADRRARDELGEREGLGRVDRVHGTRALQLPQQRPPGAAGAPSAGVRHRPRAPQPLVEDSDVPGRLVGRPDPAPPPFPPYPGCDAFAGGEQAGRLRPAPAGHLTAVSCCCAVAAPKRFMQRPGRRAVPPPAQGGRAGASPAGLQGLGAEEQAAVLALHAAGALQVLVVVHSMCWSWRRPPAWWC